MAFGIISPGLMAGRMQPQIDMEIDWTHPIANGMTMCLMPSPRRGSMIDMTGRTRAITPGVLISGGPYGVRVNTWSITNATTTDLAFLSGPWAIGCFGHLSTAAVTSGQNSTPIGRDSYTSESVNAGIALQVTGGSPAHWGYIVFANNAGTNYNLIGTSTASVGDVFLGGTSDGSTIRRLFVNGIQEATAAVNLNPTTTASNFTPFVSTSGVFDGSYLILAWTRDVTAAEWAWLYAEPYCFMRPRMSLPWGILVAAAPPVPYQQWYQLQPILAQ